MPGGSYAPLLPPTRNSHRKTIDVEAESERPVTSGERISHVLRDSS